MSFADYRTLKVEKRDRTVWIILNRPESMNSVGPEMVAELSRALDRIEADRDVRCLVITGNGRAFCAGADLKAVKSFGDQSDEETMIHGFLEAANMLLCRIERLFMPVIAAVNGLALAGGLEIVLCCAVTSSSRQRERSSGTRMPNTGCFPGGVGRSDYRARSARTAPR